MSFHTPSRMVSPSARAAAASVSMIQGSIGTRPGTSWAQVSLARSLVPSTKQVSRVRRSRRALAISWMLRIAAGVSIIAQTAMESGASKASRWSAMLSSTAGDDTFGIRIASGLASMAARRSPSPQGVCGAFTRITSSRWP